MGLKATPEIIRPGDYLYASCPAERFGEIVDVDYGSAPPRVDVRVYNPLELMQWDPPEGAPEQDELGAERDERDPRPMPSVIVRRVPLGEITRHDDRPGPTPDPYYCVVLNAPWQGCYRCVHLFSLQRDKAPDA